MSTRSPHSKTHRFIEVLALMVIAYACLDGVVVAADVVPRVVPALNLVAAVLVVLGLLLRSLRKISWIATLFTGLVMMVVRPHEIDGTLLCLLSVFLILDSGLLNKQSLWFTAVVAVLILAAQIVSTFFVEGGSWIQAIRFVVTDALSVWLIVLFRNDLWANSANESKPVLRLASLELSCHEVQILQMFWAGLSSKEIAAELNKSDGAIRTSLSQLYRKLNVTNAKGLVALFHSHRVILGEATEGTTPLLNHINHTSG